MAEWLVVAFSFYEKGLPKSPEQYHRCFGKYHTSGKQDAAFVGLVRGLAGYCRSRPAVALARGRGISKLHKLCSRLDKTCSNDVLDIEKLVASATPVAVDKIKDRLPQTCCECAPGPLLRYREKTRDL